MSATFMTKINTKQQYFEAMAEIEGYLQKGFSRLTAEEDNRLAALSQAVEVWEMKEYPMPVMPAFRDILIWLVQSKRSTQSELSETLSVSKSLFSEIINGKKQPNLEIVVSVHQKFGIDANVLLESIKLPSQGSRKKRRA
jgi:HTH-type transcriptional regulator/antitoxin HigA